MEYSLKIKRFKTPTDANWITTISGGYLDIKGRVYDFSKASDARKKADGTISNPFDDEGGYWKANAELTGLINPFTNPISNAAVTETRIEVSFTDTRGWGSQIPGDNYFEYVGRSAITKIEKRYKELYGVEIDLSFVKIPDPPKEEPVVTAPITASASGPSASTTTTTTEIAAATSSTTGASASGASASNIDGEFTFNVEQDNTFIGVNNQFGTLYTIGIGEIKEEPLDIPEELLPEEGLDEEYQEEGFSGLEETSIKIDYTPTEADKQSEVTDTKTLSGPVEIPKPKEGEMTISAAGLKKLKAHEGSRSTIYDDATGGSIASYASCKGFPTIGVGHLIDKNERSIFSKYLKPGKMTTDEIDNLLLKDLASRIKTLNKKLKVKVTQGQFEALLSMGFNTGFGSNSFLKAIAFTNEGKKQEASNQINSGPKTSKGKLVPGLVTRRKDESVAYLA